MCLRTVVEPVSEIGKDRANFVYCSNSTLNHHKINKASIRVESLHKVPASNEVDFFSFGETKRGYLRLVFVVSCTWLNPNVYMLQ